MKKNNIISFLAICFLLFTASCENDDIESKELDSSLYWVSFSNVSLSAVESTAGIITARVALSSETLSTDVPITYSLSPSSDAVEDVDYILPAGFGSAVILAGQHFVDVELATLINDDIIEGDKILVYTLESAGNFPVGLPNSGFRNTYTLTIKEDDFTLIKGTSFEEPIGGTGYTDLVTQDITHDLVNNPGDSPVDYISIGNELGFDATFISTRVFTNPNGMANEPIGVLASSPDTSFTDGVQGYGFADTDGIIKVTFDEVDISSYAETFISLDLFVRDTGFEFTSEAPDRVRITVIVDGGEALTVLDLDATNPSSSSPDHNDYPNNLNTYEGKGSWTELILDLTGYNTAQLVVEVDTNFNTEVILIDNIKFLGL